MHGSVLPPEVTTYQEIAVQILTQVKGIEPHAIPKEIGGFEGNDAEFGLEELAIFTVWINHPDGHNAVNELGWDTDLIHVPFPAIISLHKSEILVYINPAYTSPPQSIRDYLSQQERLAPSLFLVNDPHVGIPFLRDLVKDMKAYTTQAAIEYLKNPAPRSEPTAPPKLSISQDGDLLVSTSARSALLESLRRVSVPIWEDGLQSWRISRSDLAGAIKVCSEFGMDIPKPIQSAANQIDNPILTLGELDDLREMDLSRLKGLGERKISKFSKVGINSIYDLLMFIPRRYLDRSNLTPIRELEVGEEAAIIGTVTHVQPNMRSRMVKFIITDGHGSITATFFNAIWISKKFKVGDKVILLGKVDEWRGRSRVERQMTNPVMEIYNDETHLVVPVYPQSAKNGVSTWEIRNATEEALGRIEYISDPLPDDLLSAYSFLSRQQSLWGVHFPQSIQEAREARARLAFDEFLRLQLALLRARLTMETELAVRQNPSGELTNLLIKALPFPLTGAQTRTWQEVLADISNPTPMHRLIQGDVGSGKTLIALLALLAGVEGGNQGALMAPTEILANQLYIELSSRLRDAGLDNEVTIALLTSKTKAKDRRLILSGIESGQINITVGTHSLISPDIKFSSLGVVVVDEQHRFGVEQRAALRAKVANGGAPDMLVMTATPIPRTAAITAFGDLEVSTIDELPPGRTPIDTIWVQASPDLDSPLTAPWLDIADQVRQGRQAFIVCPLVEGSEKLQASSATETFERLAQGALAGMRLLLVHGQQAADERTAAMAAFAAGEADVLVSTTVIEVGVNVPNASRMVILDADRFGIAQLHQLRGRVGRGQHPSRCYLIAQPASSEGQTRLQALCDSTDGFYLSEVDLSLRGAGNILGSEQSGGVSDFRVADIMKDKELLEKARDAARQILSKDPSLTAYPLIRREVLNAVGDEQAEWLFKS